MDKMKVLIVGGDYGYGRSLAKLFEEYPHMFDVEHRTVDSLVVGKQIHSAIADDMLLACDFTELENRVMAHMVKDGVVGLETVYTGRDVPAFDVEGHRMFSPTLRIHKRESIYEEWLQHLKPSVALLPREKRVGADHPTRKREPKGPRGRWG